MLCPPEALEMDLSQEGPDQNFESALMQEIKFLGLLLLYNFLIKAPLRLQAMDKVCYRGLQTKKFQYIIFA